MSNTAFISTAIPYVNAKPHIGFALELIQADAYARYLRLKGVDTFFLTGTDENSLKNVRAAEKEGLTTKELCEQNAKTYQDLTSKLNISNNYFIRTSTDIMHKNAAQKLWMNSKEGDIYSKNYEGYYCVGCEDFYSKEDVPDLRCPEHEKLEFIKEKNYFFRLSAYQNKLIALIESGKLKIIPDLKKNEMLSFAKAGLEDISISRTNRRAGNWGIPVPNDPDQVMYVWYDALTNYISALNYFNEGNLYQKYWSSQSRKIHFIGKGINRFHSLYWPAMLMSTSVELPNEIFVHGYLTNNGRKMSKALGNVIDPIAEIKKYGTDAVRYYLLKAFSSINDGDYNEESLIEVYNADLANNLGNLIRRVETFCEKTDYSIDFIADYSAPSGFHEAMKEFRFNDAVQIIINEATILNKNFEIIKPWELLNQNKNVELKSFLDATIKTLQKITFWLEPFIPATSMHIKKIFIEDQKIIVGNQAFPRLYRI